MYLYLSLVSKGLISYSIGACGSWSGHQLIEGGQSASSSGAASPHICNLTCSLTDEVLGRGECGLVKIYFYITDRAMQRSLLLIGMVPESEVLSGVLPQRGVLWSFRPTPISVRIVWVFCAETVQFLPLNYFLFFSSFLRISGMPLLEVSGK